VLCRVMGARNDNDVPAMQMSACTWDVMHACGLDWLCCQLFPSRNTSGKHTNKRFRTYPNIIWPSLAHYYESYSQRNGEVISCTLQNQVFPYGCELLCRTTVKLCRTTVKITPPYGCELLVIRRSLSKRFSKRTSAYPKCVG
jgi:hypothetical protein